MTNYTLINSIESNGQQYIDTGLTPSQVDKIEVRARSTVADRAILGCGTSNSSADRLQAYADVTYYSSRLDGTVVMSSVNQSIIRHTMLSLPILRSHSLYKLCSEYLLAN